MNKTSLVIGVLLIAYGIGTVIARKWYPDSFWKLRPMQDNLGEKAGTRVHVFFYTVVPILMGILAIIAGVNGVAF